jgi:hypothetical protein
MSAYDPIRDVLFVHVPKTAGTSMEQVLFPHTGGHETVRDFQVNGSTFKFAFVRNPWDRIVSAFFCRHLVHLRGDFPINIDGFNRYIQYSKKYFPGEFLAWGVNKDHFRPMTYYLLDEDDNIGMNYIGRFETLNADWENVCDRLGEQITLPHYRKSKHEDYRLCYTAENWNYIGELYRQDIELFGYD